ncbi:hypothetical protein N7528_007616 [Penicillium herquei]|nr:hypothetical protein N7528_007616 [Penicillium herquei]
MDILPLAHQAIIGMMDANRRDKWIHRVIRDDLVPKNESLPGLAYPFSPTKPEIERPQTPDGDLQP